VFTNTSVVLNLFPAVRLYRGMEIFSEMAERCGATVLPVSSLVEDTELFDQMVHFSANTIMGMPTRLLAYARYLATTGRTGTLPTVLFGGEFMQ
jgi:phenylacetate-CoA ligase